MYPFPPAPIPGDDTLFRFITHAVLSLLLMVLAWLALRRRGEDASNSFSAWVIAWIAILAATLVVGTSIPSDSVKNALLIYAGLATMICFRGAVQNLLPSFREIPRKSLLSVSEAFVLVVIIMIFTALLLPDVQSAPSPGYGTRCKNNMKQLALAMHNFHDMQHRFPSAFQSSNDGGPPVSWRIMLLPHLENQSLFEKYDTAVAWDKNPNASLMKSSVEAYRCPAHRIASRQSDEEPKRTSYAVPVGPGTVFGDGTSAACSLDQITDGTSTTILIVEACGTNIIWSEPRDIDLSSIPMGVNLPGSERGLSNGTVSGYHKAGAYVALADGSVRFLPSSTNPGVLKNIMTATGSEDTRNEDF